MKDISGEERIKKIGAKIKKLRADKGYSSYEDFAFKKGFDRKQMWRVEQGQNLKLTSLIAILDALETPLSEFFRDIE
ncbi:MAG: helix-turn-helix domain-containing protein [Marinoscillum sp.]